MVFLDNFVLFDEMPPNLLRQSHTLQSGHLQSLTNYTCNSPEPIRPGFMVKTQISTGMGKSFNGGHPGPGLIRICPSMRLFDNDFICDNSYGVTSV